MRTFEGMPWDEAGLDLLITDSQLRAPGIRMFYRQADADIRAKIIAFLKASR